MLYYLQDIVSLHSDIKIAKVYHMIFKVEKRLDSLGRITLPKSIREYYGIALNDKLTLIPIDDGILITKDNNSKKDNNAETKHRNN